MSSDFVSIMMPAYNAGAFIGQAIESVLGQRYSNWELIIVDDGSTDKTSDIIAQFSDLRIKSFHQQNSGEAAARNLALENAQGKYLAFLDADDIFLPNHLDLIANYFQVHPEIDGVYTDGYYISQSGQRLGTLSSRRRGPFKGDIFEEVVRASDVFGPPICVAILINRVKDMKLRFDEKIVIGPDWDFMTRYSEGAQFGYINQTTCRYRIHNTNITIRAGSEKRSVDLARCREKAIKLENFNDCSVEVRTSVFYDLLVNLLHDLPDNQSAVTQWSEFTALPDSEQARILRLMASKAISSGANNSYIEEWLHWSQQLNLSDWRAVVLRFFYRANPDFCRRLLAVKNRSRKMAIESSPFEALGLEQTN